METFTINKFTEMKQNFVWKNGIWEKVDDCSLSIQDRGLRFGDGIFETILIKKK